MTLKITWPLGQEHLTTMKRSCLIILLSIACFFATDSFAQNDCPSLPSRAKFDTLGYIKAGTPTDPSNPEGKLYLGQGWANRGGIIRPGFIPSNKPSWAIATAVAWNLGRNMVQRVEYPNMNYWMATLIQETELRCATGMTWDDPSKVPDAYDPAVVYAAQINNGCLQIEGPGSAWSALQQAYPNGRIPISPDPATNTALYDQIIEGVDGFEGSALVKTYYDAYTSQIFNYNVGWDFYENVDCKQNNGHDPYAYTKMSASNYNGGPNAFLGAEGILNDVGPGTWTGLPATTAGYANDIAKWVSVLEDNTSYAEYPAGSSWGGWYDDAVPFSEVTKYIDLIRPMFPDVDIDGEMVPDVEAAFIAKAGSLGGTINFSDFGEVIDAIVLNIPNDKPTPVDGSPIGIDLGCTGDFLPYGHVDIINGTTTMCLGRSVTLELMVDAGNDPDIEFKWFKGDPVTGTQIATTKQITITPTALGTEVYSGQICNPNGCYTVYSNNQNACQDDRNLNGFTVTANDCDLCPFTASATAKDAICKGTADGSITLTLANTPANYRVSYIATTPIGNDTISFESTGDVVEIENIRDGAYNFVLEDLTDPDCKAYTNVIVGYVTEINEYIDADLLGIADCEADLGAEIKELPAPCLWKVQVHTPIYFQWEAWVNAVVKTSTGKVLIQKDTRVAPKPEIDDWNNTPVSEFWLSLNTGDEITVGTALTTTPGASQLREYEFNIFDEADNKVYTASSPAGSAKFGISPDVGTYTVTCPDVVPNYTIAWTPGINDEVTTGTSSTGNVAVQNDNRTYLVTATNVDNPQCILTDTVVVEGDPLCGTVCANPGDVTLTDLSDVKLTDTIRACSADTTIKALLTGNDPGTFLYELFKDDVSESSNTTGEFTLTESGTYHVFVSDNADAGNTDCHAYSDTIELIMLTPPTVPVLTSGNVNICAGASGEEYIIDRVDGATDYAWSYDGTNVTFNPADPTDTIAILDFADDATGGTLKVVASNYCGADSLEVVITVDPVPTVGLGNDTAICDGTTLTLDAGNPTALFEWNDGTTDQTLDVNAAGIYWVAVTNGNCSDTDSIEITINAMPVVDLGNDTSICAGDVTFDATTAGATYEWHDGTTDPTFTGATSIDPIWVAVTIAGCSDTDSVALSVGGELMIDLGRDTTICENEAPFGVTVSAYATIEWLDDFGGAGSSTTFDVDDSTAVYLRVEDATGCIGRDTIIVDVNPLPTVDLGPADTNICAASGGITLDAGNAGATYLWEPDGETSQTIDVTATGEYKVEVTVDGCSARDSMDVTVLGSVVLDLGNDTTLCTNDGDLTLDAGAGFTSYDWDGGPNTQEYVISASGTYTVNVVDADGCEASDDIEVTINTSPVVDLGGDTTAICATSPDVNFDAGNAGSTFVWNSGENSQVISKGAGDEGAYKVIVTTPEGCSDSDSIYLKVDTELTVNLGPADTAICTGTTITLDAGFGAGYSYDWNGAGPTVDKTFETGDGFVTVEVSDPGGCTGSADITVTEVNPLSIDLGSDVTICEGEPEVEFAMVSGRTDVTIIGWTGGSTDRSLTTGDAGVYTLEVDSAGCRATDDVELIVNALPVVSLGADTFVCAGVASVITLDAGAFVGYQWADISTPPGTLLGNTQTQDVTAVGTYAIGVTDINGCMNSDTIVVEERTATAVDISDQNATICPAGSHEVGVPAGLSAVARASWVWTNDGSTGTSYEVSGEPDGASVDVNLEYTNEFGCVTIATATVDVSNVLPITLRDTSVCEGGDITISSGYPAAGYTFAWQDGSTGNDFTLTGATLADGGSISVDIVSDEGCDGDANATLTINVLPNPVLGAESICDGDPATLDHLDDDFVSSDWVNAGTGAYVGSGRSIDVTDEGTYEVTVTDANGCVNTASADVTVNTNPVVNLAAVGSVCEGEIVPLSTGLDDATHTFQWSGGSTATTAEIDATTSGTYSVEVEVILTGCTTTDEIELTFDAKPIVELGNDTNICVGDDVVLNSPLSDQSYDFEWSTTSTTSSITVAVDGVYELLVTNGSCSDSDSVRVTTFALPESRLHDDTTLCFDDFDGGLFLNPGRGADRYLWSTGEETQVINVEEPGLYLVNIYNEIGCYITDNVTIYEDCPANVWLPNAITADGNGLNDDFVIQGRSIESVNVLVFNRWGELIWEGNRIGASWDGTHQVTGLEVQQDVYVYKLSYSYINVKGSKIEKRRIGHVALIR